VKKSKLFLLDANVVIYLFELGIWNAFVERCDVHLARTVVDEAAFYQDADGNRFEIELDSDIEAGRITVFSVGYSQLQEFLSQFGAGFIERLDPGEAESLAYLDCSGYSHRICSADKIVYRVLGAVLKGEAGVSLEEVLTDIGLGRNLLTQFSKSYRERWTRRGFEEGLRGIGLNS